MSEIRRLSLDELPLWQPGEERQRALFELVRDNWYGIRGDLERRGARHCVVMDRASAEQVGEAWPPPIRFHYRGADYGLGSGDPAEALHNLPPELRAALDAHPRGVLITAVMGGEVAQFVFDLDRGPPGVTLTSGDRPPEHSGAELLAALGPRRANLFMGGRATLARNYTEARARGISRPVLLTLDLADRGARHTARLIRPGDDPKKIQKRALRHGQVTAAMHVAASPESVARVLGDYSQNAAVQVLGVPPDGRVWYVIVSEGRTQLLGIGPEVLT
jgi:hypothetical protein